MTYAITTKQKIQGIIFTFEALRKHDKMTFRVFIAN